MLNKTLGIVAGMLTLVAGAYFMLKPTADLAPVLVSQKRELAVTQDSNAEIAKGDPEIGETLKTSSVKVGVLAGHDADSAPLPKGLLGDQASSTYQQTSDERVIGTPLPIDHVVQTNTRGTNRLVHGRLRLTGHKVFAFVVPAHEIRSVLHGQFTASSTNDGDRQDPEQIDVLLMSEQEFNDFAHDRPGETTFTHTSSEGSVSWILKATASQSQKYYLVLRNASLQSDVFVQADFAVDFD